MINDIDNKNNIQQSILCMDKIRKRRLKIHCQVIFGRARNVHLRSEVCGACILLYGASNGAIDATNGGYVVGSNALTVAIC